MCTKAYITVSKDVFFGFKYKVRGFKPGCWDENALLGLEIHDIPISDAQTAKRIEVFPSIYSLPKVFAFKICAESIFGYSFGGKFLACK